MLPEFDIDAMMRTAGALWMILVGLLTLVLSLLALLLPLFVWRILHWSRMSAQELSRLNTWMERLQSSLTAARGRGGEIDEFIFTSTEGPKREKPRVREMISPRRARSARRKALASGVCARSPRPQR